MRVGKAGENRGLNFIRGVVPFWGTGDGQRTRSVLSGAEPGLGVGAEAEELLPESCPGCPSLAPRPPTCGPGEGERGAGLAPGHAEHPWGP